MIQGDIDSNDSSKIDPSLLDLQQCWYDSPIFKRRLERMEESSRLFEANIKPALSKLSASIVSWMESCVKMRSCSDLFQKFLNEFIMCYKSHMAEEEAVNPTKSQFSDDDSIDDDSVFLNESDNSLKSYQKEEDGFIVRVDMFTREFSKIESHQTLLIQSTLNTFLKPLETRVNYIFNDLKIEKKRLERSIPEYQKTLDRYMAKSPRDSIIDSAQEVARTRKEWYESILSYTNTINQFHKFRTFEFVEKLFDFVEIFSDSSKIRKTVPLNGPSYVDRAQSIRQCEQLVEYHMPHMNPIESDSNSDDCRLRKRQKGSFIIVEGYLYKKSTQSVRILWSRRYFSLNGHYLHYYSKHYKHSIPIDLRLCQLRLCADDPTIMRRNCFELQSPIKSYWLQAENESELAVWTNCIKDAINYSLSVGSYDSDDIIDSGNDPSLFWIEYYQKMMVKLSSREHHILKSVSGNSLCADCSADNPEWCCIMYGSLVCIECCGIHRGLGVIHSKVRSLVLDHWENEMMIELMKLIGNQRLNNIYEGALDPFLKPNHTSSRDVKEIFILEKYVKRKYMCECKDDADDKLYKAVLNGSSVLDVFHALLLGGNFNQRKNIYNDGSCIENATLLHLSLNHGNGNDTESILISLILLLWNVDPEAVDFLGRNAFHYASMSDNSKIICYLARKKGSLLLNAKDIYGQTPYDLSNTKNVKSLLKYISSCQ